MQTWKDHRTAINARLEKLGKTKYWLAQQLKSTVGPNMLYSYLRGDKNTSSEKLEAIMKVLGLRLTDFEGPKK